MLGLGTLPYKIGAALIAIMLVLGGTYAKGRHDANSSWQIKWDKENARVAAEKAAEATRQAEATRALEENAKALDDKHATEVTELQKQLDEYADELAKRPASARCSLDDSDVKRLRGLTAPGRTSRSPLPPKRPRWFRQAG